jgi:hypothetical protein
MVLGGRVPYRYQAVAGRVILKCERQYMPLAQVDYGNLQTWALRRGMQVEAWVPVSGGGFVQVTGFLPDPSEPLEGQTIRGFEFRIIPIG